MAGLRNKKIYSFYVSYSNIRCLKKKIADELPVVLYPKPMHVILGGECWQ